MGRPPLSVQACEQALSLGIGSCLEDARDLLQWALDRSVPVEEPKHSFRFGDVCFLAEGGLVTLISIVCNTPLCSICFNTKARPVFDGSHMSLVNCSCTNATNMV